MLRQPIPQIVATLQCVNHPSSIISRPEFDSYLTLFKPEGWEAEFDNDKEKQEEMLADWDGQVSDWMTRSLGASKSERTSTEAIQRELRTLLRAESMQGVERKIMTVHVGTLATPRRQELRGGSDDIGDLDGVQACVMVNYEDENLCKDFPTERASGFGVFKKVSPVLLEWEMEMELREKDVGFEIEIVDEEAVVNDDPREGSLADQHNQHEIQEKQIRKGDILHIINGKP